MSLLGKFCRREIIKKFEAIDLENYSSSIALEFLVKQSKKNPRPCRGLFTKGKNVPMEIKPLVTVVTITFNLMKAGREKTFRQCLNSVHAQTYSNIEHLVIDGASTDGTIELIKEYSDKEWIQFISEPDFGVYYAMNKGVNLAKGKYITFLNSDDFYHNNSAIEISVDALESTESDYSFADTIGIDNKKNKPINVWCGNIDRIPFGTHYCHQSMLVKTNVIREMGGFDTSYKVSADSDLMIKLIVLQKKHVYVAEKIVSYRSGGLSSNHLLQCRREHSNAFFKHIGKHLGMTDDECYSVWNFSVFTEKDISYCLQIAIKLTENKKWLKEYINKFNNFFSERKRVIYLLGILPLVKIKRHKTNQIVYLFGFIPVMKIKSN